MTKQRGEFVDSDGAPHVTAAVHPASVLRERSSEQRRTARAEFVGDLRKVAAVLDGR